jgi:oligopeptide transport system substrate-binding protein
MTDRARRTRWMAGLAVLTLSASAAAACGGSGSGGSKDDTFVYALLEPTHLTPGNETGAQGLTVMEALFDRLTMLDKTGKPVNNQAESITSDDQKTWTIKVKPGLTFANGEPVTAQSYVDAWNAASYGPNAWVNGYYFGNIEGYDELNPEDPDDDGPKQAPKPPTDKLKGLKVVDQQTFTVTLTAPFSQYPLSLAFLGFAPMPKAAYTDLKKYNEAPIGNGPFMMDGTWQHNRQIKLKKNPNYKGPRPAQSEGVTFRIYPNRETAFTDLRAGKIDFQQSIPAPLVPQAKRTLSDRFKAVPSGTMDYLEFPLYDKRFASPDLRKAISMAIDRQSIVNAVYNGAYKPTGTVVSPIVPGYRPNACGEVCTYNPAKARTYLTKAGGWKGTLELYMSNQDSTYQQWMTDVANQLKQNLGIQDIKLRIVPQADYLGKLTDHDVTGPYRANWIMDYPSPENYLTTRCSPDNRQAYEGKACNALIEKGNAATSLQESLPFYQQAEDVLFKDLPIIPLWNWQDAAGYSKRLGNVNMDPYLYPLVRLDQVTVK